MHSTAAPLKAAFNSRADDQVILVGWQSQYGFPTTKQHIIPQQLTKEIQGFWPDYNQNATRNMMELPYNVDDAVVSGLAHQRGGHEPYSKWMAKEVEKLTKRVQSGELTPDDFRDKIEELQDTTKCRHNRALAKDYPNQLQLHRNDPNADMVHELSAKPLDAGNTAEAGQYVQRLLDHNRAHNPGYAGINDHAADPVQLRTPSRTPEFAPAPVLEGDDTSCPGGPGDPPSAPRQPEAQTQERGQDSPSTLAATEAFYAASHPRLMGALTVAAGKTAELTAAGFPQAAATRGLSLLPAAGSALVTFGLATGMAVDMASEAASDLFAPKPDPALASRQTQPARRPAFSP
jgi:hypothetical protein